MFIVDWRESPHGKVYVKTAGYPFRGISYEELHI
jgi:hypothetical protein